jgi:hypothetical protein
MKYGVLIFTSLLLASCATMRNADTRPTEGPCVEKYDSAKSGDKEILAGGYLLPGGIILSLIGPGLLVGGLFSDEKALAAGGAVMTVLGPISLIVGIIVLIDGNLRVNEWNDTCIGATAAERYCLFEPLPTSSGETP